jgi:hypothetical protein
MSSLYDITIEQKSLINEIEELEGEITPEMEERLIIAKSELQQKTIAYMEVISSKDSFNSLIDSEIKRLQGLKKQNNSIVQRLKDNLLMAVKSFGAYQIGTQKIGTRKSSSIKVDADKINDLPKQYKTIKVTEAPDKKALKDAIKNGEEIDGVSLVENVNLKIN